ncbi:unnamed protein product [Rhizoctonia solani]|uniref:Uncharacterized protein n=1 Tax=Rhizoctonia solani TaxID=456999 RepID=A0A8H3HS86_9AGAM|nr:unnamed protein product [Rhizoctonia solani]
MSLAKLPPEVLYLIAVTLINGSESIASLCVVNRGTYQALHVLLYRSINLRSVQSVTSLYGIITSLQPEHSVYITSLQIGPEWCVNNEHFRLNRSLAPQLHRVLQNLGNLKSLSLAITPNALNVLLSDLVAPFHLDTFAHSGKLSTPLLRFLEQQSSITKLGWQVAMSQREVDSLYFSVEGNPRLLPELEVLEGPLNLLKALIQIRRISRVTIFQWLGYYSYIEEFLASIKLAMVPITQLGFVDDVPIGTGWIGIGWIGIAKRLQSTPAFSTLKELRVVKLFRKSVDDYGPKIGDVFPSNPPFDFLHFEALEKFEFTHSTGVRHAPPPVGVDEWLIFHQMHQLTAWRELSPSLHTVLLWGSVVS